jgi:hypothetical protein
MQKQQVKPFGGAMKRNRSTSKELIVREANAKTSSRNSSVGGQPRNPGILKY